MYLQTIFTFNNLFWFFFALVNFSLITLIYKLFGRLGLFTWIAIGTFVANIQVIKMVDLFGFKPATLGNIMYGTIFLASDCLTEKYGKKDAQKSVYLSFFILVSMTIIMQLALQFKPSPYDFMQEHLEAIFDFVPRVVAGSLTAYITSQLLDIYLFSKIKEKLPSDRFLWVRNNVSTFISQLIDTAIFVTIAFAGTIDTNALFQVFISTFVIKIIVALLDTPFIYLMKRIKPIKDNNTLLS